jgi:Mce-associated membrane protein
VRDKGVRATAQVVRAALVEIRPDLAKVLLFLNQETSSRDRPEPAPTASSVIVSMTKVDGKWLISVFDPV